MRTSRSLAVRWLLPACAALALLGLPATAASAAPHPTHPVKTAPAFRTWRVNGPKVPGQIYYCIEVGTKPNVSGTTMTDLAYFSQCVGAAACSKQAALQRFVVAGGKGIWDTISTGPIVNGCAGIIEASRAVAPCVKSGQLSYRGEFIYTVVFDNGVLDQITHYGDSVPWDFLCT